jgi:hypothetical protein
MSNLWWLLGGGLLMSGIVMAGSLALILPPRWLDRLLLPLVAVAAGALLAYAASQRIDIGGLALFGAGNFLYIAASDLIPEIKAPTNPRAAALHFALFVAGVGLVAAAAATSF